MEVHHVVWDWNGTLLDDFDLLVEAASASAQAIGGPAVTAEHYRAHFCRPVSRFYETILGRELTQDQYALLGMTFASTYAGRAALAPLAEDAKIALETVAATGRTQSVCSMWSHSLLVPMVAKHGLGSYFTLVHGLDDDLDGGAAKAGHLATHLGLLQRDLGGHLRPESVLVIGDSLDDAHAASLAGARCVLVEGGSHQRHDLDLAGVATAGSLSAALRLGEAVP